jgi:hypothetical protein
MKDGTMEQGMTLNRPQRVAKLAALDAPVGLLANEIRLAMGEYMDLELQDGIPRGRAWPEAAWCLVVRLQSALNEWAVLKSEVRLLRQKLKAKEAKA